MFWQDDNFATSHYISASMRGNLNHGFRGSSINEHGAFETNADFANWIDLVGSETEADFQIEGQRIGNLRYGI